MDYCFKHFEMKGGGDRAENAYRNPIALRGVVAQKLPDKITACRIS
jgi:hypothetical protein